MKITCSDSKVNLAIEQAKKDAVHGVLFTGFDGHLGECSSQPAIISNANIEIEKKDFFTNFFGDNGDYLKYVTLPKFNNAVPTKVGKSYKIEIVVSVSKDLLRKDMETAGMVKRLSTGF